MRTRNITEFPHEFILGVQKFLHAVRNWTIQEVSQEKVDHETAIDDEHNAGTDQQIAVVEFIGGPFDGHIERFDDIRRLLNRPKLAIVISRATFQWLAGTAPKRLDRPTGMAIYQLEASSAGWRYRHLRTDRMPCDVR